MGSITTIFGTRRRQRGNAILEGGMVLVPLMALIFAFIDHGLAIFLQNTFQHAVREGVRYAVTYQRMAGMGQDASIQTVVQRNAMGFLKNCNSCIKIRYYKPDTLAETTENVPGNLVEVSVEGYQLSWMAPLMRKAGTLSIVARAADRMEGLPGGQSPPAR
ncbi:MAG: pilus assembly protein [Acidobacteria bacterium]|nr:pilus assembly protein [Acidobacteriota bacterium]